MKKQKEKTIKPNISKKEAVNESAILSQIDKDYLNNPVIPEPLPVKAYNEKEALKALRKRIHDVMNKIKESTGYDHSCAISTVIRGTTLIVASGLNGDRLVDLKAMSKEVFTSKLEEIGMTVLKVLTHSSGKIIYVISDIQRLDIYTKQVNAELGHVYNQ